MFLWVLLLGISKLTEVSTSEVVSIIRNGSTGLTIKNERIDGAVVWATFENSINDSGWSYLEVRSNPQVEDDIAAYAAGVAEATLTLGLIVNHTSNLLGNYCLNNTQYCETLETYYQNQLDWLNERSAAERNRSPFWNQAFLYLKQLAGMSDVVSHGKLNTSNLFSKVNSLYILNALGSLEDLETAFNRVSNPFNMFGTTPCSMLIKVTDNDLLVGHNTWTNYRMMLRIQKKYVLKYKYTDGSKLIVPGHTISMSSYPALLYSLDDFYIVSSGLLVTETTNMVFNKTLYKSLQAQSVPTSLRAMIANRITTDGRHWTRQFEKHNCGTYNNQWSIIDHKKITVENGRVNLANETFWMLEQLPTLVYSKDMTQVLRDQLYWSSYNVPYFESIYNASGYAEMFRKHGDRYSHDNCPRGKIFRRDQFRAEDTESLLNLLRYNDFRNDPFSVCNCTPRYNPVYSIAARYDLLEKTGKYDDDDCTLRADGAIDAKVADSRSLKDYSFLSISGPTNLHQPTFVWSKSGFDRPLGHPDVFDFKPVRHTWKL